MKRCLMATPALYDERTLLARVAEGDQSAFRDLFLQWHQLLAGYVLRITESRELTEEIVQDVFMKIWTVRETLTGIHDFKHFLLVVSRNRTFDLLKKQLRETTLRRGWEKEQALDGLLTHQRQHTGNEIELLRLSLIEQAIENLPPRRKQVFLLSRGERLSYQEIASRLDISRESVKTHLKLAAHGIASFVRSNTAHITEVVLFFVMLGKNL